MTTTIPAGSVIAYAGPIGGNIPLPSGWLLCDGTAVSRTTFAALFHAIGTSAGAGDGSTTFNLPDYRGFFLRGLSDGSGRDPDATTRTAMAPGGNIGDRVSTLEQGQVQAHPHGVNDPGHLHGVLDPKHGHSTGVNNSQTAGGGNSVFVFNGFGPASLSSSAELTHISIQPNATGLSIQQGAGTETRPINATVNYLIATG
jgi:microcystin-dependent protein